MAQETQPKPPLAIELAPLHVDTELANRHAQVLHGENRAILTASLSTTSITRSLDTQWAALAGLIFASRLIGLLPGNRKPCRGTQTPHGIVRARVARSDAAVLVGVRGDVGDELLCRECQEARQALVCLWRGRKTRAGHVVVCYCVGNLQIFGKAGSAWSVQ